MKSILALSALVAAVSAQGLQKRAGNYEHGYESEYTTVTLVKTEYLTTCPVTTTKTEEGSTYTEVYTTVSTTTTEIPVTIVVTPTKTATKQLVSHTLDRWLGVYQY